MLHLRQFYFFIKTIYNFMKRITQMIPVYFEKDYNFLKDVSTHPTVVFNDVLTLNKEKF